MLKIRPARIDDATVLMHVRREAVFSKAANHYSYNELEEWAPAATPDRVTRVEQELSDPAFVVFVAETDEAIIGFAMAIPSPAELRALYVQRRCARTSAPRRPRAFSARQRAAGLCGIVV